MQTIFESSINALWTRWMRQQHRPSSHRFAFERLESRYALIAEGQPFSFDQNFETTALGGSVSGTAIWGDGTSSPVNVLSSPASGPLSIRFDYSLDANNFFSTQERRNTLQLVANSVISKFSDQLLAIRPVGSDQWTAKFLNPATGAQETKTNLVIEANEILIFAGGRNFSTGELARGEKGGFSASSTSQVFIDTVKARGQVGALSPTATDFGPWGGTVAFSLSANWHFGATESGLDTGEADFASIAAHELFHSLGFGLSNSWNAKVSGGFTGPNASAVYGQSPVPLSNDLKHWSAGLSTDGRLAAMAPDSPAGLRRLPTRLDYAAMQDIGWQLLPTYAQVNATHIYGDNGVFPATLVLNGSTFGSTTYQLGVNIENAPPVLASRGGLTAIQGIPLQVSRIGQFTDPGFGAASASPPRQESFTYSVNWGDGTATDFGNATIESLGAPGAPSRGYFDGLHTYVQTGSYAVTMSVSDDDGGTSQQQFVVSVGVPPRIEISLDRANVSESAGPNSASLKIQIFGFDPAIATTITLTSRDVSEIQLPSSVNIPAGQASVVTSLQAIDDTLLDGTVRVGIVANAGTIASNEVFVDVLDEEQIQLSLNVPSISEHSGAGAATLLVTRSNTDLSQSVVVLLSSNDTSEVQLPPQATIPAGQANVTVGVTAVDDSIWDGSQVVTLSGSSVGYASASVPVTVTDYQPLSLALQSNEILEDDPTRRSTLGNLSIRSPAPSNGLTFQLVADVANQLILPATVFIASGLQTVQFPISAVDDFIPQGRRNVRITASGNGVIASTIDIVIVDTDPAIWTNPNNRLDVNNSGSLEPLDVLAIINEINRRGVRALNPNTDQGIAFVDTNANGQIDPLDALGVINELNRI